MAFEFNTRKGSMNPYLKWGLVIVALFMIAMVIFKPDWKELLGW